MRRPLKGVEGPLRKILGPGGYTFDPSILKAFGPDLSPFLFLDLKTGVSPTLPDVAAFPSNERQISRLLAFASRRKIPIIPYAAGSGVCGGTVPVKGGIALSLARLNRIIGLDKISGIVRAEAGVLGPDLESDLNREGFTLGHFPASFQISTVGGWLATKSAGQSSTRYGKIEDMIVALRVALPDGRVIQYPAVPRSSTGPSLMPMFLGSEGTLGVIIEASLRVWPSPEEKVYQSYSFPTFGAGIEAVRSIMRSGLIPTVVRLYDEAEAAWYGHSLKWKGSGALLVLVWEGARDATRASADAALRRIQAGGTFTGSEPAEQWEKQRYRQVDDYRQVMERSDPVLAETIEISALWKDVLSIYDGVKASVKNALCTAHLSHAYPDGAGLYLTFLFQGASFKEVRKLYRATWKMVMDVTLAHGAGISHHHGIGLIRAPWMKKYYGEAFELLQQIKRSLDPAGIMNPGKLGL